MSRVPVPGIFFLKTRPKNFSLFFSLEMKVGVFSRRLRARADFRLKVLERTVARAEQRVAFLNIKKLVS